MSRIFVDIVKNIFRKLSHQTETLNQEWTSLAGMVDKPLSYFLPKAATASQIPGWPEGASAAARV